MLITKKEGEYEFQFQYNPNLINAIKATFPNRRFDFVSKRWFVPTSEYQRVVNFAQRWGFQFNQSQIQPEPEIIINPLPELQIEIPLKRKLYPYQAQGVAYAIEKKRCIIGDKPGLGKTGQSIAAVLALNAFPCLVICPDDPGPQNWEREWGIWTNKRAKVITPSLVRYLHRWIETDMISVFIVGYGALKKYFVDEIKRKEGVKVTARDILMNGRRDIFKSVIVDESHKCANFSTMRTKIVKKICEKKEVKYLLSGTSFVNGNMDLGCQLGILERLDDLGGWKYFKERYCAGETGSSNGKELNAKLRNACFYSRNKEDVLTDLPAKFRQVIYCEMDEKHWLEYKKAEDDLANYLRQFKEADDEKVARALRGEAMVRIGICKNIAARGKLASVKQFISDAIEGGDKMVIFLHQHEVLHEMCREFPEALTLTGLDEKSTRMGIVDQFQENPAKRLIFVSMKVGGELITLTASSHVGFIEMGWNPAIHDQCEDRTHRIGQKDSVLSSWFIARNTIDEWNYNLIEGKRKDSDDVLGGISGEVETDIVNDLANALLTKKAEVPNE